jgi:hypothetical protein
MRKYRLQYVAYYRLALGNALTRWLYIKLCQHVSACRKCRDCFSILLCCIHLRIWKQLVNLRTHLGQFAAQCCVLLLELLYPPSELLHQAMLWFDGLDTRRCSLLRIRRIWDRLTRATCLIIINPPTLLARWTTSAGAVSLIHVKTLIAQEQMLRMTAILMSHVTPVTHDPCYIIALRWTASPIQVTLKSIRLVHTEDDENEVD